MQHFPCPTTFKIPVENFSIELKQSIINGTISTDQKHELMNHLALQITTYTKNLSRLLKDQVAVALIETFPQLMRSDLIGINGLSKMWLLILGEKIQQIKNNESNS